MPLILDCLLNQDLMLLSRSPEGGPARYTDSLAFCLCVEFVETSPYFPFNLYDLLLHLVLFYYCLCDFLLVRTKVTYI